MGKQCFFFITGQIGNILGCVTYTISITATQLCCCSTKAAIDNKQINGHGYVPIKPYLQKQVVNKQTNKQKTKTKKQATLGFGP